MGEEEIHVTAAVAYGLMAYVAATGDHALMTDYGAEILFETSRFWASRLEAMPDGRYALSRVVGPDEFHEHVDNSAYTNYLVRWHLQQAAHVYADLAVTHPAELASLSEPDCEIDHFRMQFVASYSSNPRGALSWRFTRRLAGLGILADLGSHAVDLAQYLLGPIARVTATSAVRIPRRPKLAMGEGTHFSVVEEGGELGEVENEDWAAALVEFESGVKGTIEVSRVIVGAEARYVFEVNGTEGAISWNFERMNELEVYSALPTGDNGYARVLMGPAHPEFARFQPGQGIPMGYDDLKVIEAHLFLQSVADGQQREPGVREIDAAARVIDAMVRSAESGAWEEVRAQA